MVFRKGRHVRRLLVVPVLLLALTACGDSDTPEPKVTGTADLASAAERWAELNAVEKDEVCQAAEGTPSAPTVDGGSGQIPASGPDYRAMLNALMETGLSQPDAAAMLPYAVNQCV